MPRLCWHSSHSYSGRSIRQGHGVHGEVSDQLGHWWNKPRRRGEAAIPCERIEQQATRHTGRAVERFLGDQKKSAGIILHKGLLQSAAKVHPGTHFKATHTTIAHYDFYSSNRAHPARSDKPLHNPVWERAHDFPGLTVPAQGDDAGIDKAVEVKEADHVAEAPLG